MQSTQPMDPDVRISCSRGHAAHGLAFALIQALRVELRAAEWPR